MLQKLAKTNFCKLLQAFAAFILYFTCVSGLTRCDLFSSASTFHDAVFCGQVPRQSLTIHGWLAGWPASSSVMYDGRPIESRLVGTIDTPAADTETTHDAHS